jgi:hypothetical protein
VYLSMRAILGSGGLGVSRVSVTDRLLLAQGEPIQRSYGAPQACPIDGGVDLALDCDTAL